MVLHRPVELAALTGKVIFGQFQLSANITYQVSPRQYQSSLDNHT